jgi:hypothetical protein
MKQKSFIIIIIVALFIAAVFLVWVEKHGSTKVSPASKNQNATSTPDAERFTKKDLGIGNLPPGITADMIMDKTPEVMQSESVIDNQTSVAQSSYIYVTKKSIKDNFAAFQKYISDKKWKVVTTVDQADYKQITANLGKSTFNVILNYKKDNTINTVAIFVVYKVDPNQAPPGI